MTPRKLLWEEELEDAHLADMNPTHSHKHPILLQQDPKVMRALARARKHFIECHEHCKNTISALWRKNLCVEAVPYMGVLIEYFVREAIGDFERIVEGVVMDAKVGFNPRNLYSKKDIEDQPLGFLIRILDTYTKDKNLIRDLRKFVAVRNKCVHKLLDQKENEVNRLLKNLDVFFYQLMLRLLKLNIKQRDFIEKAFHPACCACFDELCARKVKL
ncbi:MAG: hypothetical protein ACYCPQ_11025 [Elusimicrobiota bacterium]